MKKTKFTESQILNILKLQGQEKTVGEICRVSSISEATFYKWKQRYSGMSLPELKRVKELEQENARLKRIVANQAVDIDILKDINSKKW
jgi:putative transposase